MLFLYRPYVYLTNKKVQCTPRKLNWTVYSTFFLFQHRSYYNQVP
ncbi:hypothetical protein vBEcoMWL3_gp098 [Escherichia phage vB_EcoM_WL-3]|nr:hypothetical protein vBEcoMWL3_gp098 [Escherichia phage vB_EcoM_WL-3]